jgi:hypothetical protein
LSFILLALVYLKLQHQSYKKKHLKAHILGLEVKSKQSKVCSSLGTLCELENQKRIEKLISPPLNKISKKKLGEDKGSLLRPLLVAFFQTHFL